MFRHFFASLLVGFTLLPQTVEPVGSGQSMYVTRAEAATALLLARNPNIRVLPNTGAFPDVHKGDWFEQYLLTAEKLGIIGADPVSHLLKPDLSVSRAEFLKMLALTFAVPTGYPHRFQDIPKNAWYADYAGIVQKFNLPLEDDASHLGPGRAVTQDEALACIQIFLRLYDQEKSGIFDEQQLAIDQARNQLTLYDVISTRKTNVVFTKNPASSAAPPVQTNPPLSLPQIRTTIVTLVNTERLKAGLPPLTYNALLEHSAQVYAELMANEGFFGHVSPEGQTLKDRIAASGYYNRAFSSDCNCMKGFVLGENLGRGQKTAEEVMRDWMNSPHHRAAILSPDYTDIGIGESGGLWVQHFGGVLLPGQKIVETER